jgi:hypothetical protein
MNMLKKLASLFSAPAQAGSRRIFPLAVRCSRCGEIIHAEIDLLNDLSEEYTENENTSGYVCRKVLLGEGNGTFRCFQSIEVHLAFDSSRRLVQKDAAGGVFVEE